MDSSPPSSDAFEDVLKQVSSRRERLHQYTDEHSNGQISTSESISVKENITVIQKNIDNQTRNNGITREKREHVASGDTPRLRGPKVFKPNPVSESLSSPVKSFISQLDPAELTVSQRKAMFEKAAGTPIFPKSQQTMSSPLAQRKPLFQSVERVSHATTFQRKPQEEREADAVARFMDPSLRHQSRSPPPLPRPLLDHRPDTNSTHVDPRTTEAEEEEEDQQESDENEEVQLKPGYGIRTMESEDEEEDDSSIQEKGGFQEENSGIFSEVAYEDSAVDDEDEQLSQKSGQDEVPTKIVSGISYDESIIVDEETSVTPTPLTTRSSEEESVALVVELAKEAEEQESDLEDEEPTSPNAPISLSFYRKQQKKKNREFKDSLKKSASVRSLNQIDEDGSLERRKALIESYQTRIAELHSLIGQQNTTMKQTASALGVCKSTPEFFESAERAECEKVLLLASKRRDAYAMEIERLKELLDKLQKGDALLKQGGHGRLTIENIILPTKEGFLEQVRIDKDLVHYFVILARCRDQVFITDMLNTAQHLHPDGTFRFATPIEMDNLENDFNITLQVYAVQAQKEKASHEEKFHILDSGKKKDKGFSLRNMLSNLVPFSHDDSPATPSSPLPSRADSKQSSFGFFGSCNITLANMHEDVFRLSMVPKFCAVGEFLKMKTRCEVVLETTENGFLNILENYCGPSMWHRRFCRLENDKILMWKYPEEQKNKVPQMISLSTVQGPVEKLTLLQCARPHSFQMTLSKPLVMHEAETPFDSAGPFSYTFAADSFDERLVWMEKISQVLGYIKAWAPSVADS